MPKIGIRPATEEDVPLILSFVRELAGYERLSHEVSATEDLLRFHLFGETRSAEVVIGHHADSPAGFALFFHNFSTFWAAPASTWRISTSSAGRPSSPAGF